MDAIGVGREDVLSWSELYCCLLVQILFIMVKLVLISEFLWLLYVVIFMAAGSENAFIFSRLHNYNFPSLRCMWFWGSVVAFFPVYDRYCMGETNTAAAVNTINLCLTSRNKRDMLFHWCFTFCFEIVQWNMCSYRNSGSFLQAYRSNRAKISGWQLLLFAVPVMGQQVMDFMAYLELLMVDIFSLFWKWVL